MALNLVGEISGQLTVVKKAGREYSKTSKVFRTLWECKCLCGKTVLKKTQSLRGSKAAKSCGCCEWHIKHNESYVSWMSMKSRCNNPKNKDYPSYGGRGISYDPKWENFVNFFIDMGDPPYEIKSQERLSLDRINTNGNYTADNCKWSTRSEQQYNKR